MNQTYDPVLGTEQLRRLRLAGVRPPAMGTALVLERHHGDAVVVRHGDRVPDSRTGAYRRLFRVDVASRGLRFTTDVPSLDPAFPFRVTVSLACQVIDPVVVVRDSIRDMTAALAPSLTTHVRRAAGRYDLMHCAAAEAGITDCLESLHPAEAIRLSGFAVVVRAVDTAEIVSASQELRVQALRRDGMRPVVHGGRTEMLAQVMALTGGDPTPLLDREQASKDSDTQARLDALRVLMGSSAELEGFDSARIAKQATREFFGGDESLIGGRPNGIRKALQHKRGAIGGALDGAPEKKAEGEPEPAAQPPAAPARERSGE